MSWGLLSVLIPVSGLWEWSPCKELYLYQQSRERKQVWVVSYFATSMLKHGGTVMYTWHSTYSHLIPSSVAILCSAPITLVYFASPGSWLWKRLLTTSKGALQHVAAVPTIVPITTVLHSSKTYFHGHIFFLINSFNRKIPPSIMKKSIFQGIQTFLYFKNRTLYRMTTDIVFN